MNFKNLILTTILLSNIPITLCTKDIELDDLLELQFLDTAHEKYLNDRKIPIYSEFSKHQNSIDQPTKQLMQAILDPHSSLASVQAALNAGANPDVNYFTGYNGAIGGGSKHHYQPALIMVIKEQRFDIAEALILAGADVNLPEWKSEVGPTIVTNVALSEITYTPLTKLIDNSSTKPELETAQLNLVKLLLQQGAQINTPAIFINRAAGAEITAEKYTAMQLLHKKKWYGGLNWYSIHFKMAKLLQAYQDKDNFANTKVGKAVIMGSSLTTAGLASVVAYQYWSKVSEHPLVYGSIATGATCFAYILGSIALLTWGELGQ